MPKGVRSVGILPTSGYARFRDYQRDLRKARNENNQTLLDNILIRLRASTWYGESGGGSSGSAWLRGSGLTPPSDQGFADYQAYQKDLRAAYAASDIKLKEAARKRLKASTWY